MLCNSTNQGIITAVPVLLVDGYNVCGYWAKLKKHFVNGNLDIARQKLIDELITFSMLRGYFFLFFRVRQKAFFLDMLNSRIPSLKIGSAIGL